MIVPVINVWRLTSPNVDWRLLYKQTVVFGREIMLLKNDIFFTNKGSHSLIIKDGLG